MSFKFKSIYENFSPNYDGNVPASGAPTGRFLKDDGTFAAVAGGANNNLLNYYVNADTGSDSNDGLTTDTPFETIAHAATVISNGNYTYVQVNLLSNISEASYVGFSSFYDSAFVGILTNEFTLSLQTLTSGKSLFLMVTGNVTITGTGTYTVNLSGGYANGMLVLGDVTISDQVGVDISTVLITGSVNIAAYTNIYNAYPLVAFVDNVNLALPNLNFTGDCAFGTFFYMTSNSIIASYGATNLNGHTVTLDNWAVATNGKMSNFYYNLPAPTYRRIVTAPWVWSFLNQGTFVADTSGTTTVLNDNILVPSSGHTNVLITCDNDVNSAILKLVVSSGQFVLTTTPGDTSTYNYQLINFN